MRRSQTVGAGLGGVAVGLALGLIAVPEDRDSLAPRAISSDDEVAWLRRDLAAARSELARMRVASGTRTGPPAPPRHAQNGARTPPEASDRGERTDADARDRAARTEGGPRVAAVTDAGRSPTWTTRPEVPGLLPAAPGHESEGRIEVPPELAGEVQRRARAMRASAAEWAADSERRAAREVAAEAARERALLEDTARGGTMALLRGLRDERVRMFDLVGSRTRFEQLFARRTQGPSRDGTTWTQEQTLEDGEVVTFPDGVHRFDMGRLRFAHREEFPADVLVRGAGVDATLLRLSVLSTSFEVRSLTFEDATLLCDGPMVDLRVEPAAVRLRRCRVIGFDCGAGGSILFDARTAAFLAEDTSFEGGFGRSPGYANLFQRTRGPARAARALHREGTVHRERVRERHGRVLRVRRLPLHRHGSPPPRAPRGADVRRALRRGLQVLLRGGGGGGGPASDDPTRDRAEPDLEAPALRGSLRRSLPRAGRFTVCSGAHDCAVTRERACGLARSRTSS